MIKISLILGLLFILRYGSRSIYHRSLNIRTIFLFALGVLSFTAKSEKVDIYEFPEDTTIVANHKFKAGIIRKIFLGSHYRKEWTTPVTVKILDIDTLYGGLKPVRLGGSRQTTNLRLVGPDGKQYVIRSVNKTPSRVLSEELQETVAADLMQDQVSAEHPYAQLVIPDLSKAACIYHTNPSIYFIPFDSSFGEYTAIFAGTLVYLEERPDEDMSHSASSGFSKNVIGTEKLFENLYKDPDHKIDDRFYAKTRLFDMWIGDWGRHEDQWRWASFEQGKTTLYRPIPRDRDHVFFKFDGIIPHVGSRKWAFRHFVDFDDKFKNILGLNRSATSLDRAILNDFSEEEWRSVAEELKKNLTDEKIENAFKKMPDTIFALHGAEIVHKLKSRRNKLVEKALEYYKELSKEVDVTGSDKSEYYIVRRLNNKSTEVLMLKSKNLNDTLYYRQFDSDETHEIRLFGLGGNDEFYIYGKTKKGPRIRIIGGEGQDKMVDSSRVKGLVKKNIIYDSEEGNEIFLSKETKDMRSDKKIDSVNLYKRSGYAYNFTALVPSLEYNPDDGIFLGLGFVRKTFGFRKYPHSSIQALRFNFSTKTNALTFGYVGTFTKIKGDWNLKFETTLYGPRYAFNYFGFGNETVQKDTTIKFYRVRMNQLLISPLFYKNLNKIWEIGLGPYYRYIEVEKTPGRFISTPEAGLDASNYETHQYAGVRIYTQISTVEKSLNPKNGMRWYVESGGYQGFDNSAQFINLASDFSFYYTPKIPLKVTFASRIGGATNLGDFLFFQANTLGGPTNLRGYRRSRFYGRSSFYHNNELRLQLVDLSLYLFPGKIGLLAFYDYGRVWADNEKSNLLHTGYGPGVWIQIYNRAVLTGTYGFSPDKAFINVQMGFLF